MARTTSTPSLALLLLALAGCSPAEPAICLHEAATCSYGALGGACPPELGDYTTRCIDLADDGRCPYPDEEVTVDSKRGQVTIDYTVNPRKVAGVTCEDYAAMPSLDPDPLITSCDAEHDGVCDAPTVCPDGTDIADCAGAPCPTVEPSEAECNYYEKYSLWCTNFAGGQRCASEGSLYVCDGDKWLMAAVVDIDSVCHSQGADAYYGCSGAFGEFIGYCSI